MVDYLADCVNRKNLERSFLVLKCVRRLISRVISSTLDHAQLVDGPHEIMLAWKECFNSMLAEVQLQVRFLHHGSLAVDSLA